MEFIKLNDMLNKNKISFDTVKQWFEVHKNDNLLMCHSLSCHCSKCTEFYGFRKKCECQKCRPLKVNLEHFQKLFKTCANEIMSRKRIIDDCDLEYNEICDFYITEMANVEKYENPVKKDENLVKKYKNLVKIDEKDYTMRLSEIGSKICVSGILSTLS